MSRKRQRSKPAKPSTDAVPEEILAEGSGPNEVVDANPQTLVEAAEGLVEKRKSRKRKGKAAAQPLEPDAAEVADEGAAPAADDELSAQADDEVSAQADDEVSAQADDEASAEVADDAVGAEAVDAEEAVAFDAAADNPPASDDLQPTPEGEAVAAVEDAVMRAEAEAELGAAEPSDGGDEEGLGAALPTTAATMDAAQLKSLVEALVFAADKPVTVQRLRQLTRVGDVKRLEQALAELAVDYASRGIALQQVSGGYQFRTNTAYSVWVQQLIAGRPVRLSRAQLETLAIVAYRQPITRPEIDEIRGVDSSATLRLLLDRSLIRTLGKKEDVGRPMLYGTTKEFLDFFSLGDLRELPTLREYSELTAESRKVMSDRLGDTEDDSQSESQGTDAEAQAAVAAVDASAQVDSASADPASEADEPGAEEPATAAHKATIEVDAWGQVISTADDEESAEDMTATSDVGSVSGAEMRDVEASVSSDEPLDAGSDVEASVSSDETLDAGSDVEASVSSDEMLDAASDVEASVSSGETIDAGSNVEASDSSDETLGAASDVEASVSSDEMIGSGSDVEASVSSDEMLDATGFPSSATLDAASEPETSVSKAETAESAESADIKAGESAEELSAASEELESSEEREGTTSDVRASGSSDDGIEAATDVASVSSDATDAASKIEAAGASDESAAHASDVDSSISAAHASDVDSSMSADHASDVDSSMSAAHADDVDSSMSAELTLGADHGDEREVVDELMAGSDELASATDGDGWVASELGVDSAPADVPVTDAAADGVDGGTKDPDHRGYAADMPASEPGEADLGHPAGHVRAAEAAEREAAEREAALGSHGDDSELEASDDVADGIEPQLMEAPESLDVTDEPPSE